MTVRRRILLPFAALTLLATALLGWAAERRVAERAEADLRAGLKRLASRLAEGGVPLDPRYLPFMGEISDARILALGPRGEVLFASVGDGEIGAWGRALAAGREEPVVSGEAYLAASAERPGIPSRVVAAVPRSRVTEIRKAAAGPVRLAVVLVGAAAVLIGSLVAASVTRPLARLGARARSIASGEGGRLRSGSRDEIGLLAETLDAMVEDLRRSEREASVGRLAAGLAHEVRNPLSSIRMHVQLLGRADGADPATRDLLLSEIDRLDAIVSELMAWAKPSALAPEPVDLADLAAEALALMTPQLAHRGIRVVREFSALPPLSADPGRIRQVLRNLLANARDALGTGGTITVRLKKREGGGAVLEVADDGPGIPAEIREKIFEPFVTGRKDGTGLGLAVVKRAVEEHGGTVEAGSAGGGTTFRVSLPAGGLA